MTASVVALNTATPTLYSFRRCPYAMRARMALLYSGRAVEIVEVSLKDKPASLLACSPKGTVPVLVSGSGVIDESLAIMRWALAYSDPDDWLLAQDDLAQQHMGELIEENDHVFKKHLDRYKYANRYPEHSQEHYRDIGAVFLQSLETRLLQHTFLAADHITLADVALAPFVRQFCFVDPEWFWRGSYPHLGCWLRAFLDSNLFIAVMKKPL
ncbi:glutathione S-transferase [Pseudomonas sp. 10B1]|uniref:glutathione S-transferase n=1 Tax=unclassified Pseudomonas TaxID=196821 RepID=UPI002AB44821|nr:MULTISPECIES: glutathione S-transferase [unclassified Pseudomonas]MDY7559414.1 glutathione S-transferase [Pseudomonas sp. AB6]MEA9979826.1 glutathione S-transferase [Pseudomonas sp. RTS4]MEA9996634.1 glutathione S-transferase [Pseudomonas sp. AA4]MEB0087933.1 glutathione S-transferase [Pseudomonas sp. RTI1]MEB0128124.1 glutathione S-transferase [Pseudomonas sp. CCC1.2]